MRSVFAVCDQEYEYAYKLMEYLHRMRSLPFEVQVFTSMEKLLSFLEKQPAALLLLSEQLADDLPAEEARSRCGKVIILQDGSCMYHGRDLPAVSKYQSAGNLLREVMDCYGAEQAAKQSEFRSRAAELTGITSVSDAALRSLFACTCAETLAEEEPVLFLSLDPWPAPEFWTDGDRSRTLSDLLYLWQTGNDSLSLYLDGLVRTRAGFSCIPAVRDPEDLYELPAEEWAAFLEKLSLECGYARILLDIDPALPAAWDILACCRRKLMISGGDSMSARRTELFRESRIAERISSESPIRYLTYEAETGMEALQLLAEQAFAPAYGKAAHAERRMTHAS